MFDLSREQARQHFIRAWQQRESPVQDALAKKIIDIASQHPEYHQWLSGEQWQQDFSPEQDNPYLHMSLHLALTEQLDIDQPPGIRTAYQRLITKWQDSHHVQHIMMDCLMQAIWQSQRDNTEFSVTNYFDCLKKNG
jgi:hypothetical protein